MVITITFFNMKQLRLTIMTLYRAGSRGGFRGFEPSLFKFQ